jgi:hypothetical protein
MDFFIIRLRTILLLCISLCSTGAIAQEHLGLKIGNFSGIHGILLNPAHNVNQPVNWDLNILSAGIYASTNYMFLQKGALFKVPFSGGITSDPEIDRDNANISKALYYNFSRDFKKFNFHHTGMVMGPSFMYNMPNNSFGVYYGIRTHLSAYDVSPELGYWYYSDSATTHMLVNPFRAGIMAWGEIGLNYGRALINDDIRNLSIGVTAKVLMGYEGYFWDSRQESDLVKIDDGVKIPNADVSLDYATNYRWDYANDELNYKWQRNGMGWGIDLGLEYKDLNVSEPDQPHRFKVGLSILDIGRISFTKNAATNLYNLQDSVAYLNSDFDGVKDVPKFVASASYVATGDSTTFVTGNSFSAWLPGAVAMHGDFGFGGRYYINGQFVFPLPHGGQGLRRASMIAITPRIETRRWEIGLPLVLTNYNFFHPGLYARLWYVTIGTDHIASWFIPHNMKGTDFYIAFKVQPGDFTERNKEKIQWRKLKPCPKF